MGSADFSSSLSRPPPRPIEASFGSSSPIGSTRHAFLIAEIIEASVDVGETGALIRELRSGLPLPEAFERLALYQRSLLSQRFGSVAATELISLAAENETEFFAEELLSLAGRQVNAGRNEAATVLYAALYRLVEDPGSQNSMSPALRSRIVGQVAGFQGQGTFGQRVEHHLRHFGREAAHPATLAGFAFGAAAFQGARLLAMSRLGTASAGLLTRGYGARFLAASAGWAAEVPALTFGSRSLRALMGEGVEWNGRTVGHELAGTAITLGLMRFAGFGAQRGFEVVHRTPVTGQALRWAGAAPFSAQAFQQSAILGSLMLANDVEARLGLRPSSDLAGNFTDSLVTLFQFHVGGRLFHAIQPRGFAQAVQASEFYTRNLSGPTLRFPGLGHLSLTRPLSASAMNPQDFLRRPGLILMAEIPKRSGSSGVETGPIETRQRSSIAPTPFNFRNVVEGMPDPIIVTDSADRVIYLNRVGRDLVEGSPLSWLQGTLDEHFRPVEGEEGIFTYSRTSNDSSFWRIRTQEMGDREGHRMHHLSDVTELRNWQETALLSQLKANLAEGLVHDAGNMIAEAYQQERTIESQMKDSLGEGGPPVSERPPPTIPPGVPSFFQRTAAREAETSARVRSAMGSLLKGVKELGTTLSDTVQVFRDNQRMLTGNSEIRILMMDSLLEKALRLNATMRERSKVNLTTDFGVDPPVMMGEEGPLLSAVLNLFINACHAMPEGGELKVRTYGRQGLVFIEVEDTGSGIAPENLPHIFEPHFTTKEHSGGTGMGLANVKLAVERVHRGQIEIESEVGRGTLFRLILPQTRPRSL